MGNKNAILVYNEDAKAEPQGDISVDMIKETYGVTPTRLEEQTKGPPVVIRSVNGVFKIEGGKTYKIIGAASNPRNTTQRSTTGSANNSNSNPNSNSNSASQREEQNNFIKFEDLQFTEIDKLWRGGFGEVKLATWKSGGGTMVALKQYTGMVADEDFKKEINALKRLHHPNIVQFFGWSQDEQENKYLVMEYLRGGSLESFLTESELIDWPFILGVLCNVAAGMAFLHSEEMNMLHRDIKPGNIVLLSKRETWDPSCKIIDFGLATNTTTVQPNLSRTFVEERASSTCGTRGYIAPELYDSKIQSKKSDVFAFGITMLDIIVRGSCWGDINPLHYQEKITNGERPQIPEYVPQPIVELIKACWHQEAHKRPSFVQIRAQLNTINAQVDSIPSLLLHTGPEDYGSALLVATQEIRTLGLFKLVLVKEDEKLKVLLFLNQVPITVQLVKITDDFAVELKKAQIIKMLKVGKDTKDVFKYMDIDFHDEAPRAVLSFSVRFYKFVIEPLSGSVEISYNFGLNQHTVSTDIRALLVANALAKLHVPPLAVASSCGNKFQEQFPTTTSSNISVLKQVENHEFIFKLALVGDLGAGKTSIIHRFKTGAFVDHYATIGVDFVPIMVSYRNQPALLHVYDTAGQERFRTISRQFYRHADAVIIVVDATSPESLANLRLWQNETKEAQGKKFLFVNKVDIAPNEMFDGITDLKKQSPVPCQLLSAKTGAGLEMAFEVVLDDLMSRNVANEVTYQEVVEKDKRKPAFKVVILGNAQVGKTSMVKRYVENNWDINILATIGIEFTTKTLRVDQSEGTLQLWDVSLGHTEKLTWNAQGVILVFSFDNFASFDNITEWLRRIGYHLKGKAASTFEVWLVGCKADIPVNEKRVSTAQAQEFASSVGIPYFETSAKNSVGIEQLFQHIFTQLVKKQENRHHKKDIGTITLAPSQKRDNDSCC